MYMNFEIWLQSGKMAQMHSQDSTNDYLDPIKA